MTRKRKKENHGLTDLDKLYKASCIRCNEDLKIFTTWQVYFCKYCNQYEVYCICNYNTLVPDPEVYYKTRSLGLTLNTYFMHKRCHEIYQWIPLENDPLSNS